jgi:hypothetical protein
MYTIRWRWCQLHSAAGMQCLAAVLLDTLAGVYPGAHCVRASAEPPHCKQQLPPDGVTLTAPSRCADGTGTMKSPHTSASPHTCRRSMHRRNPCLQHIETPAAMPAASADSIAQLHSVHTGGMHTERQTDTPIAAVSFITLEHGLAMPGVSHLLVACSCKLGQPRALL